MLSRLPGRLGIVHDAYAHQGYLDLEPDVGHG